MEAVGDFDVSKLILEKRLLTVDALLRGVDELMSDAAVGYDADPGYGWWLYALKEREPLSGTSQILLVKAVDKMLMSEIIAISEVDFEGVTLRVEIDTQSLEDIDFVHHREFGSREPGAFARSLENYLTNDAFLLAENVT